MNPINNKEQTQFPQVKFGSKKRNNFIDSEFEIKIRTTGNSLWS